MSGEPAPDMEGTAEIGREKDDPPPDPEQVWDVPPPTSTHRSDIGNECRYGPDKKLIPDTVPYNSADPQWGTYNYGAKPVTWDHFWKDMLPSVPYGNNYTPGQTTVTY